MDSNGTRFESWLFSLARNPRSKRLMLAASGLLPRFLSDKYERRYRQDKRASMPEVSLERKYVEGCRVLVNREELLTMMPKGGVAAEIGAAYGDFSRKILELAAPSKLFLIDLWEGERYSAGLKRIRAELGTEIESGTVEIAQGYSTKQLERFADGFFDWVYIDTDHSYETTLQELRLASKKVKAEGIIAGHDFCTGNVVAPYVYGVMQACHEFCVNHGYAYVYLTLESHGHFSFALRKIETPVVPS